MNDEQHINDLLKQLQVALAVVTRASLDREAWLKTLKEEMNVRESTTHKLYGEVAALQAEVAHQDTKIHQIEDELSERTWALEFYADPLTYDPQVIGGVPGGLAQSLIMEDVGQSARNILGKRINWYDSSTT
jgi:hypothetical protein